MVPHSRRHWRGVGLLPEILVSCMEYLHTALGSLEGVEYMKSGVLTEGDSIYAAMGTVIHTG